MTKMSCSIFMQVWDISTLLNALAESVSDTTVGGNSIHRLSPIVKFGGHKDEGYAIDWSPIVPGRLVSGTSNACQNLCGYFILGFPFNVCFSSTIVAQGDCNSSIHLWEPSAETWNVDSSPFVGHAASVEDLQVGFLLSLIFFIVNIQNILIYKILIDPDYHFAILAVESNRS